MRQLVIGDIHGCYYELCDLLDKAGLATEDEIIAVGDIVDRGPESPRVLDFFRQQPNARSVMGNHERKHVRSFRRETPPALSQLITRSQLGEDVYVYGDAIAFLDRFPRFLGLPDALVVHGYFEPGKHVSQQRETVLVGTMTGDRYLRQNYDRPWYELYDGPRPIIVGHQEYGDAGRPSGKPFVHRDLVFGLDTGCCHGRSLTGLLLPDFRFISVSSRGDHWAHVKNSYAHIQEHKIATLSWRSVKDWIARLDEAEVGRAVGGRLTRLRSLDDQAEEALSALHSYILERYAAVLAASRADHDYDALTTREQARAYASQIGETPLTGYLHLARKGELTLDALRERFKKPGDVVNLARRIGLPCEPTTGAAAHSTIKPGQSDRD
jgi:serine/threonine protein phosphatase 1